MEDFGASSYHRYLEGDADALNDIVREYGDSLVRFAHAFLGDTAAAEDVMEDTFAVLIVKRKKFDERAKFGTYLFSIARNKCLDILRVKKRYAPLNEDILHVASVENFADEDESVKSVRFEGEKAYVCTAVEKYDYEFDIHYIIDPVFEFDLGDLDNISYTSTGTIPGYSLSLIKFGGDLLGIGYGDKSDTLKIELYRSDDDKVIPIAKYEFYECEFSSDFKAYFIDAENLLVGLSVAYYDTAAKATVNRFLLLKFDGTEFVTVGLYDCEGSLNTTRACYDDGRVLLFNTNTARVIELPR